MTLRPHVAGVEIFRCSGCRKAYLGRGRHAHAGRRSDRQLRRADTLPRRPDFDDAMPGLCAHIATLTDSIVGFDFPFSIPAPLIEQSTWPAFIRDFADRYATPEEFRETCRSVTGGREFTETDIEAKVPWCAYNSSLSPDMGRDRRSRAAGFSQLRADHPDPAPKRSNGYRRNLPASKREGLYFPYKGRGPELQRARSKS